LAFYKIDAYNSLNTCNLNSIYMTCMHKGHGQRLVNIVNYFSMLFWPSLITTEMNMAKCISYDSAVYKNVRAFITFNVHHHRLPCY